jgi:hypothetical protein
MQLQDVKKGQVVSYMHLRKRIEGTVLEVDSRIPHFPVKVTIGIDGTLSKVASPEELTLVKEVI